MVREVVFLLMNCIEIKHVEIGAKERLLNVITFCCQTWFPQLQKVARKSKIEFETQPPSRLVFAL